MNIKDTINFKTLREKGPSAIDVHGDEVVQVISKGTEVKVLITQEHYLELLAAYNHALVRTGVKSEKLVDLEERLESFEASLTKIMNLADEETKDAKRWHGGRKKAGRV